MRSADAGNYTMFAKADNYTRFAKGITREADNDTTSPRSDLTAIAVVAPIVSSSALKRFARRRKVSARGSGRLPHIGPGIGRLLSRDLAGCRLVVGVDLLLPFLFFRGERPLLLSPD